jgi:hypothetical protein
LLGFEPPGERGALPRALALEQLVLVAGRVAQRRDQRDGERGCREQGEESADPRGAPGPPPGPCGQLGQAR